MLRLGFDALVHPVSSLFMDAAAPVIALLAGRRVGALSAVSLPM